MENTQVPSRQEMFNRAYLGLKSQGFTRAVSERTKGLGPGCSYLTPEGHRCAWGWVDPTGTLDENGDPLWGSVMTLREDNKGLAARLSSEDCDWACELQVIHDLRPSYDSQGTMQDRLEAFAVANGLTIPTGEG